jgi:hypothetical protein
MSDYNHYNFFNFHKDNFNTYISEINRVPGYNRTHTNYANEYTHQPEATMFRLFDEIFSMPGRGEDGIISRADLQRARDKNLNNEVTFSDTEDEFITLMETALNSEHHKLDTDNLSLNEFVDFLQGDMANFETFGPVELHFAAYMGDEISAQEAFNFIDQHVRGGNLESDIARHTYDGDNSVPLFMAFDQVFWGSGSSEDGIIRSWQIEEARTLHKDGKLTFTEQELVFLDYLEAVQASSYNSASDPYDLDAGNHRDDYNAVTLIEFLRYMNGNEYPD